MPARSFFYTLLLAIVILEQTTYSQILLSRIYIPIFYYDDILIRMYYEFDIFIQFIRLLDEIYFQFKNEFFRYPIIYDSMFIDINKMCDNIE